MQTIPNISASSIKALKKCPMSWYLAYVQGIREVETADVLRIGSNWHAMMEILKGPEIDPEKGLSRQEAALELLGERYLGMAQSLDVERTMLAYSFLGYCWRYGGEDGGETIAVETRFEIPYGMSNIVGVIDRTFITPTGRTMAAEYKTTGRDIGLSEDFWNNLSMSVQPRMYVWASREIGKPVEGIEYDVFRKPNIKPRMLSAADTKKFLVDFTYMDTMFDVAGEVDPGNLTVDGEIVEIKWNKAGKAFAIRETMAMYGARILADIYADPDKFFRRKEVVVTEPEIIEFTRELVAVYSQMQAFMLAENVYKNEDACDTPYRCPYQAICYSRRNQEVIDGGTPAGYKRIKLTYGETK